MSWRERYLDRFYNRECGWADGTSEFHSLCKRWIRPGSRILEVGAGPTNPTSQFLATVGTVHGIDPDRGVRKNIALNTSDVMEGEFFPVCDEWADACVSNYVVEHIRHPSLHLHEVARVLKQGGVYVFRTPNRFHYTALVGSATPHWFHRAAANRLRNRTHEQGEPHPTFYAMNTRRKIDAEVAAAQLDLLELRMVEKEPSYGMASRVTFLAFMAYERIVNTTTVLAGCRSNIFAVVGKGQVEA